MAGFDNETVYASNVDFTGNATVTPQMLLDGQLLIGSTVAPNIRVATFAAGSTKFSVTNGAGTITGDVVPANIDINTLGSPPLTVNHGGTGQITLTNHAIMLGAATSAMGAVGPSATSGTILQSAGSSADPVFSTATYPSTAGTSGKVLISNGTNIVSSTPTFPNASATSGKFIQSDGTNWIASTPTLPTTGGTSGTILRSNGTNFVNTTATYPTTTTINQILYSSAANVIGAITSGNGLILATNSSGVPSFTSSFGDTNFTFTNSAAGRTLTLSSTEATTSTSDATFRILTNTTSGGSPYVMYVIQSATISYALGVDNTDSQSFKLTTDAASSVRPSTGTLLQKITSGGNRTLPLNSCITADLSADITNATGDGTYITPVIFNVDSGVFFDQNSNYNTSTGLFTAPVTGKYLVTATITFIGISVSNITGLVRIDLAGATYAINSFSPYTMQDGNNTCCVLISCIIPANATNTIGITAQVAGGTKTVGIKGNFFGSFSRLSINLIS